MAKLIRITSFHKRKKKWEHFKLRFRIFLFRMSVLLNLACLIYFLDQDGKLTNIYMMVNPILEAIINKLPL